MKALPILILSFLLITTAYSYADSHWIDKGQYLVNDQDAGILSFIRYSADGKKIYTFSDGSTLRFWDRETGEILFEKDFKEYLYYNREDLKSHILGVDISGDGKYFVFTDDMGGQFGEFARMIIYRLDIDTLEHVLNVFEKPDESNYEFSQGAKYLQPIIDNSNLIVHISAFRNIKTIEGNGSSIDADYFHKVFNLETGDSIYNEQPIIGYWGENSNSDFNLTYMNRYDRGGAHWWNSFDYESRLTLFDRISGKTFKLYRDHFARDYNEPVVNFVTYSCQSVDNKYYSAIIENRLLYLWHLADDEIDTLIKNDFSELGFNDVKDCFFSRNNDFLIVGEEIDKDDEKYTRLSYYDFNFNKVMYSTDIPGKEKISYSYNPLKIQEMALGSGNNLIILKHDFLPRKNELAFEVIEKPYIRDSVLQFINYSWGDFDGYLWDFGYVIKSTEENPVHSYNISKTFTTRLYGQKGQYLATTEKEIIVIDPVWADFESDLVKGQAPLQVKFYNLSEGKIKSLYWDFGDGETSAEENPTHIYKYHGLYDVTLTVKFDNGAERTLKKEDFIVVKGNNGFEIRALTTLPDNNANSYAHSVVQLANGEIAALAYNDRKLDNYYVNSAYKLIWMDYNLQKKNIQPINLAQKYINLKSDEPEMIDAYYEELRGVLTGSGNNNVNITINKYLFNMSTDSDWYDASIYTLNDTGIVKSRKIVWWYWPDDTLHFGKAYKDYFYYQFSDDIYFHAFIPFNWDQISVFVESPSKKVELKNHSVFAKEWSHYHVLNKTESSIILFKRYCPDDSYLGEIDIEDGERWHTTLNYEGFCPEEGCHIKDFGYVFCGKTLKDTEGKGTFMAVGPAGEYFNKIVRDNINGYDYIINLNDSLLIAGGNDTDGKLILTILDKNLHIFNDYYIQGLSGKIAQIVHSDSSSVLVFLTETINEYESRAKLFRVKLPDNIIASTPEVSKETKQSALIFPNPASSILNISGLEMPLNESNTTIYNRLGQDVTGLVEFPGISSLNISNLPDGVYYIRVKVGNEFVVEKVVVMK